MGKKRNRRKRRPDRHVPTIPEWRRWWTWVSLLAIPVVIAAVSALYAAHLSLDQAGEQEAEAQQGAEQAKDDSLADQPAITARVRPMRSGLAAWIFPEVVDGEELRTAYMTETEGRWDSVWQRHHGIQAVEAGVWYGDSHKDAVAHHVTLVGNRREKILVVDARVRIVSRSAPLDGTLVWQKPQGSDVVERVVVDLDGVERRLELVEVPVAGSTEPRPLVDARTLTLEEDEAVGLELVSLTSEHHYQWLLELTVDHGAVKGEIVTIDAGGVPFETTAWSGEVRYRGGIYTISPDAERSTPWGRWEWIAPR